MCYSSCVMGCSNQISVFADFRAVNIPWFLITLTLIQIAIFAWSIGEIVMDCGISQLCTADVFMKFGATQSKAIQEGDWWRFYSVVFVHSGFLQ
eukprot:UN18771